MQIGDIMSLFGGNACGGNQIASVLPLLLGAKGSKENILKMLSGMNPALASLVTMLQGGKNPCEEAPCGCPQSDCATPCDNTSCDNTFRNFSGENCAQGCTNSACSDTFPPIFGGGTSRPAAVNNTAVSDTAAYPYELQYNHPDEFTSCKGSENLRYKRKK